MDYGARTLYTDQPQLEGSSSDRKPCNTTGYADPAHQPDWSPAGPPIVYRSSETDSLLSGNGCRKTSVLRWWILIICCCGLGFLAVAFVHFAKCPLYPSAMDEIRRSWEDEVVEIRRGWEDEVVEHRLLQKNWTLEEREHSFQRETWKVELEWHEKNTERRAREEEQHQGEVRKAWEKEVEQHRVALEQRQRRETEHAEKVRKAWEKEAEQHRQVFEERRRREIEQMESLHRKWQREIDEHDRLAEDRRKREEEERQKLNMFWGHVEAHQCTTYGTKEYTALLMNLPATWEHRVEACKATPLEVHGISYLPKSCEDKGPGIVMGRWEVNQNEPDCASFWLWYKDKGCTSERSGKRRIEHYLENLPHGGDWREFCATTPASFHDMHFAGAQECFQYNLGTYGHWEIDDSSC
ncbi:hypothetical protein BS17DRAFT_782594 [Gyrodon lividus]|nr:hypothetical protein BS17DRAFT_782594 [Gyrodon lividus]